MYLEEFTGRGVRIAVIDSGVHAQHPHVNGVFGGFAIHHDGTIDDDYIDRMGHGTAVTAAIREKAPDAEILAIKVFDRDLKTDVATLVRALDEASARGAALINLSLGTADASHAEILAAAVARAKDRGSLIVSAVEDEGVRWLPGSLDSVVGVRLDWICPRDIYRIVRNRDDVTISASGYPRDIPGVRRERNLKGISFAVANASAFVARALEGAPQADRNAVFEVLAKESGL